MLGEPAEFHGFVPDWGPLFWELSEQDAEQLVESGDGWQQMLAVMRASGEEAPEFLRLYGDAMRRLNPLANDDKVRWTELMNMVLSLAHHRRPRTEREALQRVEQEAQANLDRQKEVKIMSQTIAESIWEEAWTKGEAKGETKGSLNTTRGLLSDLLIERFGPLPEAIARRLDECTDLAQLKAAFKQAIHIEKLEDLQL